MDPLLASFGGCLSPGSVLFLGPKAVRYIRCTQARFARFAATCIIGMGQGACGDGPLFGMEKINWPSKPAASGDVGQRHNLLHCVAKVREVDVQTPFCAARVSPKNARHVSHMLETDKWKRHFKLYDSP